MPYLVGKPTFGTLIALLHKGVPVLGVIDQCISRERWIGVQGQPTTLNGNAGTKYMHTCAPHLLLVICHGSLDMPTHGQACRCSPSLSHWREQLLVLTVLFFPLPGSELLQKRSVGRSGEVVKTRSCERLSDAYLYATSPHIFVGPTQQAGFARVRDRVSGRQQRTPPVHARAHAASARPTCCSDVHVREVL